MKHKWNIRFFITILVFLLAACKKETETLNVDLGLNYFPEDSGTYVVYKVDSTIYDDFTATVRKSTVYLKEVISKQFPDNLDRTGREINRYYGTTPSSGWQLTNVFYIVKTNKVAERVEDNLRYVKMVFPNNLNDQWLGNKYIISPPPYILDASNYRVDDWQYTITDKDQRYDNSYKIFDSTMSVFHIYDSSAINKTYSMEKYARNVGLVYKELWIVTGQTNIGQPWEDRAQKGFILRQYAIDYGKE